MKKLQFAIITAAFVCSAVCGAQEQPPAKVLSGVLDKVFGAYNSRDAQAFFNLLHPELQKNFQEDFQNAQLRELFEVRPPNMLTLVQWNLERDYHERGKMLSAELKGFDQEFKRHVVLFRYEIRGSTEGFIALKKSEGAWLIIEADLD